MGKVIFAGGKAGMNKPVALPSGYTALAYIQGTGTQYIDTGFAPNNNTRVVMDAAFSDTPSGNVALFGARETYDSNNYALMCANGSLRSDYNTAYDQTWSVDATTRRVIDKNKETTTIDGTSQSYTNAAFQSPVNLVLFANNDNGTVKFISSAKIYSCQIYDNGTMVRDFVPCVSDAGAIGLFNLVNNQFYGNAGSGSFVGSEVA